MSKIGIPTRINQIVSIFYFIGLWHDNNYSNSRKLASNVWFLVVFVCYIISVALGAVLSENEAESIFLANISIIAFNLAIRLYYWMWKQDEIIEFIEKFGTHSIEDGKLFSKVDKKISNLVRFTTIFTFMTTGTILALIVLALPIVSNEKRLPLNIYIPFNWKESEVLYCVAFLFFVYEMLLATTFILFNLIIWYLLISSAIKYEILGNEFMKIGLVEIKTKLTKLEISLTGKQDLFIKELIVRIRYHRKLQKINNQFKACFSNVFFIQIGTSGINICCSVYALAFHSAENLFLYEINVAILTYSLFDIFMVTYFGNEIKFWSSRLSYCLFECNWMDQSKKCKKCIFILMEVLKRQQVLVVGKLYPLNLEIFTQILNLAYSMFNLLIKLK